MPVESEAEVAAAAQSLVSQGVETVIVTLGARGALIATREGARPIAPVEGSAGRHHRGRRRLHRQLRYLAGGLSVAAALTEATRYSALSVTRHGAQKSYPTEAEFAAFAAALR